MTEAGCNRN